MADPSFFSKVVDFFTPPPSNPQPPDEDTSAFAGFTADNLNNARQAGYTDQQILDRLSTKAPGKFDKALQAGYTPTQIVEHVANRVSATDPYVQYQEGVNTLVGANPQTPEATKAVGIEAAKGIPIIGNFVDTLAPEASAKADKELGAPASKAIQIIGGSIPTMAAAAYAPWAFGAGMSTPGAMVASGLSSGALQGTDSGIKYMQGKESGPEAIKDTALATGIGAAAPLAGAIAGGVMRLVKPDVAQAILKGVPQQTIDWLSESMKKSGMTDAQIAGKLTELGPEGILAEYNNQLKGRAVGVATQGGGEGQGALSNAVNTRGTVGAPEQRITAAVDNVFGPKTNLVKAQQFTKQQTENITDPLFQQWKTAKLHPTKAMDDIYEQVRDANLDQSIASLQQARSFSGNQVPATQKFFKPGPNKENFTPESWGLVRQNITGRMNNAFEEGRFQEGMEWKAARARLDNEIAVNNPAAANAYKEGLAKYGEGAEINKAREFGQKNFLDNENFDSDVMGEYLKDLSPDELEAFSQGARGRLDKLLNAGPNGASGAASALQTPDTVKKIQLLAQARGVNPADVEELLRSGAREKTFADTANEFKNAGQKQINKEATKQQTPNPKKTLTSFFSHFYNPDIRPGAIPIKLLGVESYAAKQQAQKFKEANDALGRILAEKGQRAADFATALRNYKAPSNFGPQVSTGVIGSILRRGLTNSNVSN
ncbi:MAG TPA: hypothetical protein VFR24_27330 [Candidatus Angelobacter sp.]|nr:hypothetical protein [Candidatus Angelobacter sp.]